MELLSDVLHRAAESTNQVRTGEYNHPIPSSAVIPDGFSITNHIRVSNEQSSFGHVLLMGYMSKAARITPNYHVYTLKNGEVPR